jgi:ABC-2 type transport system permease protein
MMAIVLADLQRVRHDPTEIFMRMIQPVIWILIFGQAMAYAKAISTGSLPYLDYIVPGIVAQSILLISIFYGISLIWEKDVGTLHKILVTPAPRVILVLGRSLAAGLRGLSQVFLIYVLAFILKLDLRLDFFSICGVLAMSILVGAIFSTFSLIVASIVKKRERFMGIGQALTMPLFFASNALYPIDMMPHWIKVLSLINPLTYQVDALRAFMIAHQPSMFGLEIDFAVSLGVFIIVVFIATKLYPKIVY